MKPQAMRIYAASPAVAQVLLSRFDYSFCPLRTPLEIRPALVNQRRKTSEAAQYRDNLHASSLVKDHSAVVSVVAEVNCGGSRIAIP